LDGGIKMDRQLADLLEKQADLTKQPFIQNAITERILEETGGEGLYHKFEIDLSVARTDEERKSSGDRLMVETVDDAVTIKLNSRKNPSIDLQKFPLIKSPIKKIYITNAAGSGNLDILVGSEGMFEAKKKLEIINPADYIICKDGSHIIAINGKTGDTLIRNTDAHTVIQHAIDSLPDNIGGLVYLKAGDYELTDTIELYRNNANWTEMTLQGAGMGVTNLKVKSGTNKNAVSFDVSGAGDDGFKTVRDLNIYGQRGDTAGHGFYTEETGAGAAFDILLKNIMFYGCKNNGIHIKDGWGVKIVDCITEVNTGHGLYLFGSQCHVSNLFSAYNTNDGIYASGPYLKCNNIELMGNDDNGFRGVSLQHANISNLSVSNWGAANDAAVNLEGDNNTLTGISIDGMGSATADYGLFIQNGSINNIITGLRVIDTDVNDIRVTSTCVDNIIWGNFDLTKLSVDAASRCILNGLSNNAGAPGVAGAWAAVVKWGAIVRDTTNNKTYIYAGAGWREISAA